MLKSLIHRGINFRIIKYYIVNSIIGDEFVFRCIGSIVICHKNRNAVFLAKFNIAIM